MKKILLIVIFIFLCMTGYAESGYEGVLDEYVNSYSEEIEEFIPSSSNMGEFPDFDVKDIMKKASKGENIFSFGELKRKITDFLFSEIKSSSASMVYLFVISMLGTFLLNLQNMEGKSELKNAGYLSVYLMTSGILASVFSEITEVIVTVVNNISIFLKGIFPVIIMSLYSSGCIISTGVLQPILSASVEISVHIIEKVFIPIVVLSFAVCIAGSLSDKINADKFVSFLVKTVKWGLGCMLTIFIGIIGLQSVASTSVDGLSVKITKFAASNLIPVVGGILSESVETVMNCSIIIKNSLGVTGIVAILYMSFMPLVKIGISVLILRFSAAVMQPVSDEKIVKTITETSNLISLFLGILASVVIMFVLIITIIINAGNSVVMLGR